MAYVLENKDEVKRLEKQNSELQYRIDLEIQHLNLDLKAKKVLDAGCGAGTLSRVLVNQFKTNIDACDFSEIRLQQAKNFGFTDSINYFVSDLTKMNVPDNQYDVIFNRFVLEHTKDPFSIIRELKRVLKPGGKLVVIELDGLMFNLYHQDPILGNYLNLLQKQLPLDLFIGRKLPRVLKDEGLEFVHCEVQPMVFQGKDLETEIEQMQMRFSQAQPIFVDVLGEKNFLDFSERYYAEMKKSKVSFFNKFIIEATK